MTTDITAKFEAAAKSATTWTRADVQEMAQAIKTGHPGARIDWEPGDEEWARVLEPEGDGIIAFVCAKIPIGFICGDGRPTECTHPFVWISVPSIDASVYSVRPEVLEQVFGRSVSRSLDYGKVSADEIWWTTVS